MVSCVNPVRIVRDVLDQIRYRYTGKVAYVKKIIYAPCGKCLYCMSLKRSEWLSRLKCEYEYSTNFSYFVTLTYDDSYLMFTPGDNFTYPCVDKRDCQLFIKRLRSRLPEYNIRYFLISEYGETTYRPHYHLLLFNLPFRNAEECRKVLEAVWQLGNVDVGCITDASINYCSKYCIKNFDSDSSGVSLKTFLLCSRNPCIGYEYVKRMKSYHLHNFNQNLILPDGYKASIPRLLYNKIFNPYERSCNERVRTTLKRSAEQQWNDAYRAEFDSHTAGFLRPEDELSRFRQESYHNYVQRNHDRTTKKRRSRGGL